MSRSRRMRRWVKPTVVLVDTNDDYLQRAKEIIEEEGFAVLVTGSQREARDIVNDLLGPAIFLVEQHLPKTTGLQLMAELKDVTRFPIELILVTADNNHEVLTRAVRIGADYFTKGRGVNNDYNLTGLFIAHIEGAEGRLRDKEGRDTDTITNAHTRRGGDTLWVPIWNRAKRHKTPTTCIFADLNGFKAINDKYGHNKADDLLGEIEKAIRHAIRTVDFIVRYGDEFVVILPETSEAEAHEISSRITLFLEKVTFEVKKGVTIVPSASLGVAVLEPEKLRALPGDGTNEAMRASLSDGVNPQYEVEVALRDLDDLVKRADQAMYAAKQARKARLAALQKVHSVLEALKQKRTEENR